MKYFNLKNFQKKFYLGKKLIKNLFLNLNKIWKKNFWKKKTFFDLMKLKDFFD